MSLGSVFGQEAGRLQGLQSSTLVLRPFIPQVVMRLQQGGHPPQVDLGCSGLPVVWVNYCPFLLLKVVLYLGLDICHMRIKLFCVVY